MQLLWVKIKKPDNIKCLIEKILSFIFLMGVILSFRTQSQCICVKEDLSHNPKYFSDTSRVSEILNQFGYCRIALLIKNSPAMKETPLDSWVRKFPSRRDRLPTPLFLSFPGGLDGKESACNVGDLGSIPGLGRSPGEGHGNTLQYSGESPWTEEPGGLQYMGLQRVRLDCVTSRAQHQHCQIPEIEGAVVYTLDPQHTHTSDASGKPRSLSVLLNFRQRNNQFVRN